MKRILLAILFAFLVLSGARAATSDTYINNGVVSAFMPGGIFIPGGVPAPDIDARNFVNNGWFGITNFANDALSTPMVPFSTWNTLNYSNRNRMLGHPGFRFNFFDSSVQRNKRAANFVNANTVNETNASIYGANYVLVDATNVINRGTLAIGGPGLLNVNGNNVDLSRSMVAAVGNETNGAASVRDLYWGAETNLFSGFIDPTGFFSPLTPTILFQSYYLFFFQFFQLNNGFTTYLQITPTPSGAQIVDMLILAQTNAAINTEVRFGPTFFTGSSKAVKFEGYVTNKITDAISTNQLFLTDNLNFYFDPFPDPMFFQTWLPQRFRANLAYSFLFTAATFFPINYNVTRSFPFFTNLTLIPPTVFDASIFFGTNFPVFVTNTAWGVAVDANAFGPDASVQGAVWTNSPGRIELTADRALNLNRTRIDGQSYLLLKSTNHFVGSEGAQIISPMSDIKLASTNYSMTISNLIRPTVPRMAGTIDVWSGRWTNANPFSASLYNVTIIDAHLNVEVPSLIQDLELRSPNLVISDIMNVTQKLLLDAERLTLTLNETNPPTASATLTGEINLMSGDLWWSASTPRLQYLTNYGKISSSNSIFFAGARRPPFFSGTFDEPYQVFISHGLIESQGNDTWANYYEFSGTNTAGNGPLSVRAATAIVTNATFFAPGGDISITGESLLVSNAVLQSDRAINLSISSFLNDGYNITNANVWQTRDGFSLLVKPLSGDLLTTTVTNFAAPEANPVSRWAADDRGCSPAGFINNAAVGRLVLDGSDRTIFTFTGIGAANAIYVDSLELVGFTATNRDTPGNFSGLEVDSNMKIYYGQALVNGDPAGSEKLNGSAGGRFCWVSNYNCGIFSSVRVLYPDGVVRRVNRSLATSCNIDSYGGGTNHNCDRIDFCPPTIDYELCGNPVPPEQLQDCSTLVPPPGGGGTGGGGGHNNSSHPSLQPPVPPLASTNVLPNGWTLAKGTYNGLFYDTNGLAASSSGYVSVKTTGRTYSGKIVLAGQTYSFSGQFDAQGDTTTSIAARGGLTVQLHLNLAGGDQLTGRISGQDFTAELIADRQVFNKSTRRTPKAGSYTVVIPGDVADPNAPVGDGFGTVKIDTAGAITFSGALADGTKVSQATTLSKQNLWPLYTSLYNGAGAIASWIQFTNQSYSDLNGQLIWMKPAGAWQYYAQGFTNEIVATGSAYKAPAAGRRVLNLANGAIIFSGGSLSQSITNQFTLSPKNKVTGAAGSKLTMTITTTSGLFKGTFFDPGSGAVVPFQGVLFKKANIGVGYFLGAGQSGEVYLIPAQ